MSGLTVQEVVNTLPNFNTSLSYSNASERQEAIDAITALAASIWSSFLDPEMCTEDQREKLSSIKVPMPSSKLLKHLPSDSDRQTFYELLIVGVKDRLEQLRPYLHDTYFSSVSLETNNGPSRDLNTILLRANFAHYDEWATTLFPRKSHISIKLYDSGDSGGIALCAQFERAVF